MTTFVIIWLFAGLAFYIIELYSVSEIKLIDLIVAPAIIAAGFIGVTIATRKK